MAFLRTASKCQTVVALALTALEIQRVDATAVGRSTNSPDSLLKPATNGTKQDAPDIRISDDCSQELPIVEMVQFPTPEKRELYGRHVYVRKDLMEHMWFEDDYAARLHEQISGGHNPEGRHFCVVGLTKMPVHSLRITEGFARDARENTKVLVLVPSRTYDEAVEHAARFRPWYRSFPPRPCSPSLHRTFLQNFCSALCAHPTARLCCEGCGCHFVFLLRYSAR